MATVLVVDDKDMMRDSVCETLRRAGFEVRGVGDGASALESAGRQRPDAVVTDLKMPGMTGIELVEKLQRLDPDLPVIVMTAFGTIETAVRAMRLGAFDYVTKPFEGDELIISLKRGLQHARLLRENAVLRSGGGRSSGQSGVPDGGGRGLERLIGESAAMRKVREQVSAVAGSNGTVLVTGESGTGKEVVAQAIHDLSDRAGGPFLAVNCAALSESLLESELFGHEKGAFTGADKLRKGRFELADGGTLLLDEVSEVGGPIQATLLRVLQERAFERVGSSTTIGVDVRVVATSNRDLPGSVAAGEFRGDLYFRLNVLPIELPPLRERGRDAAILAEHFVHRTCLREGIEGLSIEPAALDLLAEYSWPGNVRELMNICERAVVLTAAAGEHAVRASMLGPWLGGLTGAASTAAGGVRPVSVAEAKPGSGLGSGLGSGPVNGSAAPVAAGGTSALVNGVVRPLSEIERETIVEVLRHFNGHRQRTARSLGIGVRTLGLKIKKWKEERLVPESL